MADRGFNPSSMRPSQSKLDAWLEVNPWVGPVLVGLGVAFVVGFGLFDVVGLGNQEFGFGQFLGMTAGTVLVVIGLAVQLTSPAPGRSAEPPEEGEAETAPPVTSVALRRPLRRYAAPAAAWLIAGGLLAVSAAALGGHGIVIPLLTTVLFIVPGELVRRAFGVGWPHDPAGAAATDVVLSMGVLVVVGGPLLAFDAFRAWSVGAALAAVLALLGVLVLTRREGDQHWRSTSIVVAVAIGIVALGLLTMKTRPFVADRVSLGQFETVAIIAEQGAVPDSAPAFGATTDFPVHYLFFDLTLGSVLLFGGFVHYPETVQFHATLRVVSLALFALGWFLAGRALIAMVVRDGLARWAAVLLPLLLFFNKGFVSKFREPLTEGWALGLMGISIWAVVTATDGAAPNRRWATVLAATAAGLLVGISLPALAGTAIFVGSWVIVMTVVWWRRHSVRTGELLAAAGWPVVLGPLAGLGLFNWIGNGSIAKLLGGSVESAADFPGQAFQALQFMAARPLVNRTAQQVLARGIEPDQLFTSGFGWLVVITLGLVAGAGFWLRRDRAWHVVVWLVAVLVLTLAYVGLAVLFAHDDVTPWNTMVRNAFYAWVPVAVVLLAGVAFGLEWLTRWWSRGPGLRTRRDSILAGLGGAALVIMAASWIPVGAPLVGSIRDTGWIRQPQMSADGHDALRWIAANLPEDARLISSEVTYGSQRIAERALITDGKGTLEDPEVTAATIALFSSASDFFLPARDPRVLIDYDIDYLLVRGDGNYRAGQFGGVPIMRSLGRRVNADDLGALRSLSYLREVERFGQVVIFQVRKQWLPDIQDDGFVESRDDLPSCVGDLCIGYIPTPPQGCSSEELSSVANRCVVTRRS